METVILFAVNLAAAAVFMTAGWVISLVHRNAAVADIFWGLGFVLVAWLTFFQADGFFMRKLLLAPMVTIWGMRLFVHIAGRSRGKGEDPRYAAWGCWNYRQGAEKAARGPATLTYYMNQLQQLASQHHYCVTLNPDYPIEPGHMIADLNYAHPMFDKDAGSTQADLPGLNGVNNTWFCGSYFRYGFHKDAVMSAAAVGRDFGIEL